MPRTKKFPAAGQRPLIVGISGASGVILSVRALEILRDVGIETHLVVTPSAQMILSHENRWKGVRAEPQVSKVASTVASDD